jgi:hypothetical protein
MGGLIMQVLKEFQAGRGWTHAETWNTVAFRTFRSLANAVLPGRFDKAGAEGKTGVFEGEHSKFHICEKRLLLFELGYGEGASACGLREHMQLTATVSASFYSSWLICLRRRISARWFTPRPTRSGPSDGSCVTLPGSRRTACCAGSAPTSLRTTGRTC